METIIPALISGLCVAIPSIIATLISNANNKRQSEENRKLTIYRIDELEKKVTKHNNLVERVYKIEQDLAVHHEEYHNLKDKVDVIE